MGKETNPLRPDWKAAAAILLELARVPTDKREDTLAVILKVWIERQSLLDVIGKKRSGDIILGKE